MKKTLFTLGALALTLAASAQLTTNNGIPYLQNTSVDMSGQFQDPTNTYFSPDSLVQFDASSGWGTIQWSRQQLHPRQAFNLNGYWISPLKNQDFPATQYDQSPRLQFKIDPVNERVIRVRIYTSPIIPQDPEDDVMLVKKPADGRSLWKTTQNSESIILQSPQGSLEIRKYPWRLVLRDKNGKELTHTRTLGDNDSTQVKTHPFLFMKRGSDNSRAVEPVFNLAPGEKIYGCGESATALNKAGQKLNLFVTDPQGPETPDMYKPIPFWFSSRGYGMFMHTSAPAQYLINGSLYLE